MKRTLTAIIILASLFITNCDINIALGTALNLNGPVLEITGPVSTSGNDDPEVGTLFNFTGTATSESAVTRMTVTLTYFNRATNKMIAMEREWKYENGMWRIREGIKYPWNAYSRLSYSADSEEYPVEDPSWTVSGKTVFWNLPVYMNRMEKGQFFIEVQAWDTAGNSDSNSKKRLKVKFNNTAPTIKIEIPLLADGGGSLGSPTPPNYSGEEYKFDPFEFPRQTYDNRAYFLNRFPKLEWTTEQNASLKSLTIEITNEHDLDNINSKKIIYYRDSFDLDSAVFGDKFSSTSGKGTHYNGGVLGDNNGTSYTKVGDEIILGQDPYTDDFVKLPKDRITPLQVVTTLVDNVGKKEYKSKGWFMYLPDSDKPFADISFGYKVKEGQLPPDDATDRAIVMRGTTSNKIYFFDDKEGLKEADWELHKLKDNSFETDTIVKTDKITFPNNPTYTSWDFAADYNYGIGRYKLEITTKDTANITGDKYTAYFTIISNTAPSILDWPDHLAALGDDRHDSTVWGSANGDIDFYGTAAVEDSEQIGVNNVKVDRVTIVLINYDNGDAEGAKNEMRFIDSSYAGWNLGLTAATPDSAVMDEWGNKIWEIPSANITQVSGTDGNKGNGHREEWKFTKTLNWFNDLNGNFSTKDKKLIVRALTKGVLGKEYYGARNLTIHGDDGTPTVNVSTLILEKRNGPGETYLPVRTYTLEGLNETIPAITVNHRIRLLGTWNDNSSDHWTIAPAGKAFPRDLFKSISIRWEGNQKQYDLVLDTINNSAKTWQTDWFTGFPDEGNADPQISLIAIFEDLGGLSGRNGKEITVETDQPTISRISSDTANGKYGVGKEIDIFLGFNKAIYLDVTGGGASASGLSLNLSNGGIATYTGGLGQITSTGGIISITGSGSEKINFKYKVAAGDRETPANGKLNVTSINYGSAPADKWKSVEGSSATFITFVFDASNSTSLAGQKNLVIDMTPPAIQSITTTSAERIYGKGQQIVFNVEFDEDVDIDASNAANTYITLTGGNLGTNDRGKAIYSSKAGARSAQFIYTIQNGDYTYIPVEITTPTVISPINESIKIGSASGFDKIKDKAGNASIGSPAISGALSNLSGKIIKVDTIPPAIPIIGPNPAADSTSYNNVNISITGIEPGASWEYHTDYVSETATTTGWLTSNSTTISLTMSGTYRFAVRQFDSANPKNASGVATRNFKINKGDLLTKITAATPSGTYGPPSVIDIELEFRIPVWVTGAAGSAYIDVNTSGVSVSTGAPLISTGTNLNGVKKLTYRYTIPTGAYTPSGQYLNVTGISFPSGVDIADAASGGTSLKTILSANLANLAAENQLNKQKEITIITGRPAVPNNNNLGTSSTQTNNGLWFNGSELGIKFDRPIYRGTTKEKLLIRQIDGDFRIPAVLTEQKFNDIFSGRDDIFTEHSDILGASIFGTANNTNALKGTAWKKLGDWLYEKGSNGATLNGSRLEPDTSVKYILRFSIDTAGGGSIAIPSEAGVGITTITKADLTALFRAAEALTFTVGDPNVMISGNNITIALTGERALPVKGASYDWSFPNGFVTDILGKINSSANNDTPSNKDDNISSSGATRLLIYTTSGAGQTIQVEKPVIRIDKGDDLVYFNDARTDTTDTGEHRQARQKLETTVKMDCRTPGATITHGSRSAMDKVRPIIRRNELTTNNVVTTRPYRLPNLGTDNTQPAWNAVRMRPQSGVVGYDGAAWTNATGLNHYVPVTNTALPAIGNNGYASTYTAPITIGTVNYSDGGIEYNYVAAATAANMTISATAYETAYRSVFVFSNSHTNTNRDGWSTALSLSGGNNGSDTLASTYNRIWIRGSNTSQGDPTIPDFPLSRNRNLWRKIKLLTPITPRANFHTSDTTVMIDADIPTNQTADGYHLWFWVTWRINVPAFVDVQVGKLPNAAEYASTNYATGTNGIQAPCGTTIRKAMQSFITAVEHYAVHPGRTTVVETREQGNMWDSNHGTLVFTSAEAPLPPSDR